MSNGYNFTERVRRVLANSRAESHNLENDYVGTEHILLGLIADQEGVAIRTLDNLGIDRTKVREDLLNAVKRGKPGESRGLDLPYTSRAKKVLELAMFEALNLKHSYVGTEHVLLGLLLEEKGTAAQVLRHNGADIEKVRSEVLRILGSSEAPKRAPTGKEIESVTIKVRFTDGTFQQDVLRDIAAAMRHLAQ